MLANRVAYLVEQGAEPERILLLTFTRRAANELIERAKTLLKKTSHRTPADITRIWGGTFHAVGMRLLRTYGKRVGLPPNFTLIDRGDQEDLMNLLRSELETELGIDKKRFPKKGTCVSIYSRCINSREKLFNILAKYYPKLEEYLPQLAKLFDAYTARKLQNATLDYDDLLLYWLAILKDSTVGETIRRRFDWVLVDEYQDTNLIQADIIYHLTPTGRGLTVVGDDAQSIYSFRAATVRNILDFPKHFPDARILPLEANYRSTNGILNATNSVIAQLKERFRKELHSNRGEGVRPQFLRCDNENDQIRFVVGKILEHREEGMQLKEQAVLYRASSHSLRLEAELARRRIPYIKYGGLKFTEAAHVKDLLAFLRVAENSGDFPAGLRLLALLPGIGPKKARQLIELLRSAHGNFNVWSSWTPPKAAMQSWFTFVELMKALAENAKPLAEQLTDALKFYQPILEEKYPNDADSRHNDLEQLIASAPRFKSRQQMLADFVLDPPQSSEEFADKPDIDDDYLVLSTIHSAKGLEWKSVFIIHASDGNIPSDMATGRPEEIDEELRLFYVAMTRARDYLYISCPMRYFHMGAPFGDDYSRVLPTRFLPPKILEATFDQEYVYYDEEEDEEEDDEENGGPDDDFDSEEWFRNQTKDLW